MQETKQLIFIKDLLDEDLMEYEEFIKRVEKYPNKTWLLVNGAQRTKLIEAPSQYTRFIDASEFGFRTDVFVLDAYQNDANYYIITPNQLQDALN